MTFLSAPLLAVSAVVVFLAGIVRGFGGFGFSMAAVAGMSLVLAPVQVVPPVVMLEVVASGLLIVKAWQQVDWKALGRLSAGMAAATPVGAGLLSIMPPAPMTIAIAAAIMVLASMMRVGFTLNRQPAAAATVGVGMLSGLLNGAGAIGGPPVVLFFFSSPGGVAISRASLIVYFLGTDLIAAGVLGAMGLMTRDAAALAAVLLLPTAAGVICGAKAFQRSSAERFRQRVLLVLIVLSSLALIKASIG